MTYTNCCFMSSLYACITDLYNNIVNISCIPTCLHNVVMLPCVGVKVGQLDGRFSSSL